MHKFQFFSPAMINYDEKMVLNSRLVIKMGIDQIGKNFVKSMSVKKFSYLGQFIQGLRTPVQVVNSNYQISQGSSILEKQL